MTSISSSPAAEELLDQLVAGHTGQELGQQLAEQADAKMGKGRGIMKTDVHSAHSHLRHVIMSHPKYPAIVGAYYHCKKSSCTSQTVSQKLDDEEQQYLKTLAELRRYSSIDELSLPLRLKLDAFMDEEHEVMEVTKRELEGCRHFINKSAEALDQTLASVLATASMLLDVDQCGDMEETQASAHSNGNGNGHVAGQADVSAEESEMKNGNRDLKRRLITATKIKEELMKKKKKGKLPPEATEALKVWWDQHSSWPYPSEQEKKELLESTNLDPAQLNNWFINQRKRHWPNKSGKSQ